MNYNFEWNPRKAHDNLLKHKISFARAAEVFLDPHAISIFDKTHSNDEDRWITIGNTQNGILTVVVHTFKEIHYDQISIRIISARKATQKESKQYRDTKI